MLGHKIDLLAPPYCLRPPDRLYREGAGGESPPPYLALWDLGEAPLRAPPPTCDPAGDGHCGRCVYESPSFQL